MLECIKEIKTRMKPRSLLLCFTTIENYSRNLKPGKGVIGANL